MLYAVLIVFLCLSRLTNSDKDSEQGKRQPLADYLMESARAENKSLLFADSLLTGWYVKNLPDTISFIDKLRLISHSVPIRFLFDSTGSILIVSNDKAVKASLHLVVRDLNSTDLIEQTILYFNDSEFFAETDSTGSIHLQQIPSGIYQLQIFRLGYYPKKLSLPVSPFLTGVTTIFLERNAIESEMITINSLPSHLGFSSFKTRNMEVDYNNTTLADNAPLFSELDKGDIYESLKSGFASGLLQLEEVGFILNGLPVLSPWLYQDSPFLVPVLNQGLIRNYSIQDDGFDVLTGNYSSSIYDITSMGMNTGLLIRSTPNEQTIRYTQKNRTLEGTLLYNKHHLKRNIEQTLHTTSILSPSEMAFGSIRFFPRTSHELVLNTLYSYDLIDFNNDSNSLHPAISSNKGALALWSNYNLSWSNSLFIQSVAGLQSNQSHSYFIFPDTGGKRESEGRQIQQITLKSSFNWNPSPTLLLSTGYDYNGFSFSFKNEPKDRTSSEIIGSNRNLQGSLNLVGLFLQAEWLSGYSVFQVGNRLTIVPEYRNSFLWDPKLSFIYQATKRMKFYFHTGHYTQVLSPDRMPTTARLVSLQSIQVFQESEWKPTDDILAKIGIKSKYFHEPGPTWYYLPRNRYSLSPQIEFKNLLSKSDAGGFIEFQWNGVDASWGGRHTSGRLKIEEEESIFKGYYNSSQFWMVLKPWITDQIRVNWHIQSGAIFYGPGTFPGVIDPKEVEDYRFRRIPSYNRVDVLYQRMIYSQFFLVEFHAGITNLMDQKGGDQNPILIQSPEIPENSTFLDRFTPTLYSRSFTVGISLSAFNQK